MIGQRLGRLRKTLDRRSALVVKNALCSMGIKGLSIIVGLLLMPVYTRFFVNQSVLGVWLTMTSMLSWIFTFDLGIGNGLRNELTIAVAQNNKTAQRQLITSTYVSAVFLSLLLAIVLCISVRFIDFTALFHIDTGVLGKATVDGAITLLIIGVLLQFVLKLINTILLALHKSAIPNALSLLSNGLLLLYLFLAPVGSIDRNFSILALVFVATTTVPMVLATIALFATSLRDCIPSMRYFKLREARKIIKVGLAFFWLQLMAMIILSTNNFLISVFVGTEEVIVFQTYFKLFSLISTFFALGMIPLWSSVAEAQATGDFRWIMSVRKKLYVLMGVAALGEAAVLLLSQGVVTIWMGPRYVIPQLSLVLLFAVYDLVDIWTLINAQVANGLGKLKNQLVFISIGAVVNVPLSYVFSLAFRSWTAIALANIISLLPFCITETLSTARYLKRNTGNITVKKELDAQ